jgi:hypothetical protein
MRTSECENPDATDEDINICGLECRLYEESQDVPDFNEDEDLSEVENDI